MKKIKIFILLLFFVLNKLYAVEISSPNAVVICEDTKRILYDKNAHEIKKMASLTKLMTSILLVENCKMDELITVDKRACNVGGSEVGLKPNSQITAHDLLFCMLLPSGNDAATATAFHISGSVENFSKYMNNKAKEIGLTNTNFTSPHGLDDENHYTTAYEMALISRYARQYNIIKEAVNTKFATVTINGEKKELKNTNALLWDYEYATGMKTGFTNGANRCLSASATKNGLNLIAVVLGANTSKERFNDAKNLLEFTFENYNYYDLTNFTNTYIDIPIKKGKNSEYIKLYSEPLFEALTQDEYSKIYVKQDFISSIDAPMYQGEYIGKTTISSDDMIIYEKEYYLEENIEKKNVFDYLSYIIIHFFDSIEKI